MSAACGHWRQLEQGHSAAIGVGLMCVVGWVVFVQCVDGAEAEQDGGVVAGRLVAILGEHSIQFRDICEAARKHQLLSLTAAMKIKWRIDGAF